VHRVGIVGSNLYGQIYAKAFGKQTGVNLVGFTSAQGDQAPDTPSQIGIPHYESLTQLLEKTRPSILCICSTTAEHSKHVELASKAGAHIICDRPIATNQEEAQQIIKAVSKSGVTMMVGKVLRFWPEYVMTRDILESGEIGQVMSVTTSRVSGTISTAWQNRLLDPNLGLGVLEALIHDIDFIGWLIGKPSKIDAVGLKHDSGALGQVQCLLSFSTGEQASCEASYLVPQTFPLSMYLRVLAEKGTLVYEFRGALSEQGSSSRSLILTRMGSQPQVIDVSIRDAFEDEVTYFLECIETEKQPQLGSLEQAVQALETILEVKSSAQ
jgi:predicted dehydrogenase